MDALHLLRRGGWLPLLVLALVARGQTPSPDLGLLLKMTPQYVVVGGYWLEVEQRWNQHPRQSFLVAPQVYAGPVGRPNQQHTDFLGTDESEKVRGAGLQVLHRWYLSESKTAYPSGLYVSYGPSFQHLAVSRQGMGWKEVTGPTGLPLLEYRYGRHTETINRYGATAQLGYQAPLLPGRVFLDLYAGLGWRESQSRTNSRPVSSRYRLGTSDYGHQGFYFPAGVKIGVAIR